MIESVHGHSVPLRPAAFRGEGVEHPREDAVLIIQYGFGETGQPHGNPVVWGSLTGKMHTITKHYRDPSSKARMAWDEDEILNFERYLPQEEEDIIELGKQTIDEIRTLLNSKPVFFEGR